METLAWNSDPVPVPNLAVKCVFFSWLLGLKTQDTTWTPKVCRVVALWAICGGLGLIFNILLGSG